MKLRIDEVSDRCVYVYRTDTYERYPHTITLTWQELRDKAATSEEYQRVLGLAEQWLAQLHAETAEAKRRIEQALREAP